jgi:hypothetical protein
MTNLEITVYLGLNRGLAVIKETSEPRVAVNDLVKWPQPVWYNLGAFSYVNIVLAIYNG